LKLLPALLKDAVRTLVRAVLKRPATTLYPKVRIKLPEGFRGRHMVDLDKCVGCGLCARDCPSGAIVLVRELGYSRGLGVPVIDLSKCIFCFQCAESCPKGAITPTAHMAPAASDPHDLILDFRAVERKPRGRRAEGESSGQEEQHQLRGR